MAVDYIHRLLVLGSPKRVKAFRDCVGRTVSRKLGGKPGWREHVPISFAAMYARCPELARIAPEPPNDPYDMSAWRMVSLPDGRSESRYKFHTRNLEMRDYLVPFSRKFPGLEFRLLTFCLDDSSMETYLIRNGGARMYTLPQKRHDWHWEQARRRFQIEDDEVYGDDEAREFAEAGMLDETLNHWERRVGIGRNQPAGRRWNWWSSRRVRELDFEREAYMLELALAREPKNRGRSGSKKKAKTSKR